MSLPGSINLKSFNTFGVAAEADKYVAIRQTDYLKDFIRSGGFRDEPVLVLGGGSNVLFVDNPPGFVLHVLIPGIKIIRENNEYTWVEAGAGVVWHDLVNFALKNNLGGIENLALIPGYCGAAPMQNIGAYGVELMQVFDHLEAVNLKTGTIEVFNNDACRFGYRSSIFKTELKDQYLITKIVLRLSVKPRINIRYGAISETLEANLVRKPGIRDVANAVVQIRQSKLPDPKTTGNAGSFFKNPVISKEAFEAIQARYNQAPAYPVSKNEVKIPAGWLIEQCGWKGKAIGEAGTWHKQALVIINKGNADGRQIFEFAQKIRDDVYKTFDIRLQPEVNLIGVSPNEF